MAEQKTRLSRSCDGASRPERRNRTLCRQKLNQLPKRLLILGTVSEGDHSRGPWLPGEYDAHLPSPLAYETDSKDLRKIADIPTCARVSRAIECNSPSRAHNDMQLLPERLES